MDAALIAVLSATATSILLWILVIVTASIKESRMRKRVTEMEFAHFDPKTAEFVWDDERVKYLFKSNKYYTSRQILINHNTKNKRENGTNN